MKAQGLPVSANVDKLLAGGNETWYKDDPSVASGRVFFDPLTGAYKPVVVAEGVTTLATLKKSKGVVKKNSGASLIDLGNGVAAIELHSKMNALGGDIISFVSQTLKPGSDAVRDFSAFVITGDSSNFSVGANLMQLVLGIQEEEWDEISTSIKQFQSMTQAIKFCARPVVVAPYGMTLGGGCEISLHAAARQPYSELYMGLVEDGVGLIPGGGGCKELALASVAAGNSIRPDARGESVEVFEALKKNFELVAKGERFDVGRGGTWLRVYQAFRLDDHESRTPGHRRRGTCAGAGRSWLHRTRAHDHRGARGERTRHPQAGRLHHAPG